MADLITQVNLIPVPPGSLAEKGGGGGSGSWPVPVMQADSFLPVEQGDTLGFGMGVEGPYQYQTGKY